MWQWRQNLYFFLNQHGFDHGQDFLLALIIFVLVFSFLAGGRSLAELIIYQLEKKFVNGRFKIWLKLTKNLYYPFIFLTALFAASFCLYLPEKLMFVLDRLYLFLLVMILINSLKDFISNSIYLFLTNKENVSKEAIKTVINFSNVASTIILWTITILIVLQFSTVDANALLGGLGIASIVVAFSLQNALKGILAFFSIYVDRSFSVGDYIVFGKVEGTIKEIRLRTTKITALKGNDVIVPNELLVTGIIENYNRLIRRRVSLSFGVRTDTTAKQIKSVLQQVRSTLTTSATFVDEVDVRSLVFDQITNEGLILKIIYFFKGGNYLDHLQCKEKVNLAVVEILEKEKVKLVQLNQD